MTEAQAIELIEATFATGWAAAQPTVPFALENDPLPTSDAFVQLTTTFTTSNDTTQGALGTKRVQCNGWIVVKMWTPAGAGRALAAQLADSVRGIFEVVPLPSPVPGEESLLTQPGSTVTIGTDGRWFMQMRRIPMWFAMRV